jgi:hypothetical protein
MTEVEETQAKTFTDEQRLQAAWSQLTLVLSFFARIDTKLSVVLGINLGMLTILFSRAQAFSGVTCPLWIAGGMFIIALLLSFFHLYRGAFPHLNGDMNSLVYFRSLGAMEKYEYRAAYAKLSADTLADDLLNQVWRNSKILTCKFHSLRYAYIFTTLAVIPWLVALAIQSHALGV